MRDELLNNLLTTAETFTVFLRTGKGFNENEFQALCAALRDCADTWANDDSIPKVAANLLVDLWPSIQACSYLYLDSEADRIMKAADIVADLTREVVSVKSDR